MIGSSAGKVTVTGGKVTKLMPGGAVTVATGRVTVPPGSVIVLAGRVTKEVPAGRVIV